MEDLSEQFIDPEILRLRRIVKALSLRPYQGEGIEAADRGWTEADVRAQLICMATGLGKCLGKGTPVLMHDGRIVPVECVKTGDLLMGPDSGPRRVVGLARGREMLYRITPTKGDSYVVNESHILSLKITGMGRDGRKRITGPTRRLYGAGDIANVTVKDWLTSSSNFKHCAKGWRTGISFPDTPVPLDPYILGLWLGDGETGGTRIATMDHEVITALRGYADNHPGHRVEIYHKEGKCPIVKVTSDGVKGTPCALRRGLVDAGVIRKKHIPLTYKANSASIRLNLLAGLIDTDGSYYGGCYDFISSIKELSDDVSYLARSLGFAAYQKTTPKTCTQNGKIGTYYRVCISGDISRIPCRIKRKQATDRSQRKDVLRTGIKVTPIGIGDYYGFEITGDRLFMLGDFTVTHNTPTMACLARIEIERGGRVLILAHTDELIDQALDKVTRFGRIKGAKEKAHNYAGVHSRCVVGSVQTMSGKVRLSMWKANHFTLVLVDEAHRSLAVSYQTILQKFMAGGARIIGVTATPDRGDKRSLGEFYNRIAYEYTLLDGVRDGWLVRPIVKTMPLEIDIHDVKTKKTAAGNDLDQTEVSHRLIPFLGTIAKQCKDAVPNGTFMFFMPSVETARLMSDALNNAGLRSEWISGDREDRRQIVADFKRGQYRAICNMAVLTEGFDHDRVDTIVCLRPTKIRSLYVQIVGRACRPLNEIVSLLGAAANANERRNIIAGSTKPNYKVLDFLWLYDKHDLVTPAALVTEKEEVKEKMGRVEGDLVESKQRAERDVLADLEDAVRRNQNRKSETIDPLAIAAELGDITIANYEPEIANDALPATEKQIKVLTQLGVDTSGITMRGHATAILNRLSQRSEAGLTSIRQLNFLRTLGINAVNMNREEAEALILRQQGRDGEWAKRMAQKQLEEIGL